MAGRASKNKGKTGERELAAILGKCLGGNWERVPYSGAYVGGKNAHRKDKMTESQIRVSKADLIPPDELNHIVVECKFYKTFPYHAFAMNQAIPLLDGWIADLEHDCDPGDLGLLCIKINRKGWMVCVKEDLDFDFENKVSYYGYNITNLFTFLDNRKNIQILKEN